MANGLVQKQTLQDIANAIRNKNQEVTTYKPSEMAAAINAIASDPKDIALDGNSYQYTTTGKNLFNKDGNLTTYTASANNSTITKTNDKITFVTSSASSAGFYTVNNTFKTYIDNFDATKTYTISADITSSANTQIMFGFETNYTQVGVNGKTRISNTSTSSSISNAFICYAFTNGITVTLENIQIEENSSATLYEKYTGHTTSPNPDYPQEVKVVEGKNLNFTPYKDGSSKTTNGVTFSVNTNGEIIANGTSTANAYFYCHTHDATPYWNLPKGNYYLTGCPSGGATNKYYLRLSLYNDTTSVASFTDFGSGVLVNASSYTYNRVMLYVFIANGQSCNNLKFSPMLEKGTSATEYLPYNNIGVKVVGKNLFDKTRASINTLINRTTGELVYSDNYGTTDYIPVKAGQQYTFTYFNYWYVAVFDKNKNYLSNVDNSATITIPNGAYYLRGSFYLNYIDSVQFEQSSTATTFEPYSSVTIPVPLQNGFIGKINDYKDILNIDLESGVISKLKNVGKIVLDGSETISGYQFGSYYRYSAGTSALNIAPKAGTAMLSNYFYHDPETLDSSACKPGMFYYADAYSNIYFISSETTAANFKTWLGTHNADIFYTLATPTTEVLSTIDQTTLTEFRNTLKNNGTLTIYSNLDPSQVRITYGYTKTI